MMRARAGRLILVVSLAALGAVGAASATRSQTPAGDRVSQPPRDLFDEYLFEPFPAADGFSPPAADLPASAGGKRAAKDVALHAIARGKVTLAARPTPGNGGAVVIEHLFYENAAKRTVWSITVHLASVEVNAGDVVERGQRIGVLAHSEVSGPSRCASSEAAAHVELLDDPARARTLDLLTVAPLFDELANDALDVSAFIAARGSLPIPSREPALLLGHHGSHRLRHYEHGQLQGEYDIAFGQAAGAKERRGDLRTPIGMYFVVARSQGPFTGDYADFYGGHWIKVNYPNPWDAERGLDAGLISPAQRDAIAAAWARRSLTPQNTRLGGGIGLHGWIEKWEPDGGAYLSWGCVVMQNDAISKLYPEVPIGTMVVLLE